MPAPTAPLAATGFEVVVSNHGTTRTITPSGELDLATVASAWRPLAAALSDGVETVVLDLSETTFLDASGVRLVVEADVRARSNQTRFVVLPGPAAVQRVFQLCQLVDRLPFAGAEHRPGRPGSLAR